MGRAWPSKPLRISPPSATRRLRWRPASGSCLSTPTSASRPALREEVLRMVSEPGGCRGFWIPRHNYLLGHVVRHAGWFPDYQLRLLERGAAHFDPLRPVHELALVDGQIGHLREPLLHFNYRSLGEFIEKQERYCPFEAERWLARFGRPAAASPARPAPAGVLAPLHPTFWLPRRRPRPRPQRALSVLRRQGHLASPAPADGVLTLAESASPHRFARSVTNVGALSSITAKLPPPDDPPSVWQWCVPPPRQERTEFLWTRRNLHGERSDAGGGLLRGLGTQLAARLSSATLVISRTWKMNSPSVLLRARRVRNRRGIGFDGEAAKPSP